MEHSEVLRHRECRRQPGGTADRRFACGLQFRGKTGSRSITTLDPGRSGRHKDVSPLCSYVSYTATAFYGDGVLRKSAYLAQRPVRYGACCC